MCTGLACKYMFLGIHFNSEMAVTSHAKNLQFANLHSHFMIDRVNMFNSIFLVLQTSFTDKANPVSVSITTL